MVDKLSQVETDLNSNKITETLPEMNAKERTSVTTAATEDKPKVTDRKYELALFFMNSLKLNLIM
jgi:hypothetical protein